MKIVHVAILPMLLGTASPGTAGDVDPARGHYAMDVSVTDVLTGRHAAVLGIATTDGVPVSVVGPEATFVPHRSATGVDLSYDLVLDASDDEGRRTLRTSGVRIALTRGEDGIWRKGVRQVADDGREYTMDVVVREVDWFR